MPPGFPLQPLDAGGSRIVSDDWVRIGIIPEWLIHDLSAEKRVRLKSLEGKILSIAGFDAYGYVWFRGYVPARNSDFERKQPDWSSSDTRFVM